jgi:hypothetical protein
VPARQRRRREDQQPQRDGGDLRQRAEHDRAPGEPRERQSERDQAAGGQAAHVDQAHAAEVQAPPQQGARDPADPGEQEGGRGQPHQLRGGRAEQRTPQQRRQAGRQGGQRQAAEQAHAHRRAQVAPLDRVTLHERRGEPLEGEDARQRHEDQRDGRAAELRRGDQAREHDGGGERQRLARDAREHQPAHAAERGLFQRFARHVGYRRSNARGPPALAPRAREGRAFSQTMSPESSAAPGSSARALASSCARYGAAGALLGHARRDSVGRSSRHARGSGT